MLCDNKYNPPAVYSFIRPHSSCTDGSMADVLRSHAGCGRVRGGVTNLGFGLTDTTAFKISHFLVQCNAIFSILKHESIPV